MTADEHLSSLSYLSPDAVHAYIAEPDPTSARGERLRLASEEQKAALVKCLGENASAHVQQMFERDWGGDDFTEERISRARRFVEEQFGMKITTPVRFGTSFDWKEERLVETDASDKSAGRYEVFSNIITIVSDKMGVWDLKDWDLRKIRRIGKVLVHELAHATRNQTQRRIVRLIPSEAEPDRLGGGMYYQAGLVTAAFDKKTAPLGSFFEEGLAEGMAGRWSKTMSGRDYCDDGLPLSSLGGRALQSKYLETPGYITHKEAFKESEGVNYASSAFPATAIDELSSYLGVDVYQYMIDSRRPELEASAKRKLVQAVESVSTPHFSGHTVYSQTSVAA